MDILDWFLKDTLFFYKKNMNFDKTINISIHYKKNENLVCIITIDENLKIIDRWWKSNYGNIFCKNSNYLEDFCIDFKEEFIKQKI